MKNNQGKRLKKVLIALGCCCILAAAALSAYNWWISEQAAQASDALNNTMESLLQQSVQDTPEETGTDQLLNQPTKEEGIHSVSVAGYDACGVLSLPSIGIKLTVLSDWSYDNLRISACRFSGAPDGQMIILAHNYKQHFAHLKNMAVGDAVEFTAVDGTVYHYKVIRTETWATDQLKEIESGSDWDLTLFTCTYGGASRVVVRCAKT